MKNNKILIIILTIVLVLSVGVGSYFIFNSIYNKEPETNNDSNNQTGNNNVNLEKTSLEILNDLISRGYFIREDLYSPDEDIAYINKKGQLVINDIYDDNSDNVIIADEIDGKVSKVSLLAMPWGSYGFIVVTEDGKLYSQTKSLNDGFIEITDDGRVRTNIDVAFSDLDTCIYCRSFEEIILPSKIKKIYQIHSSAHYYVLLKNNEVYELKIDSNANTDMSIAGKLTKDLFIDAHRIVVSSSLSYPILRFSYDEKTYFDNGNTIFEIKDENGNSINTKYAISSEYDSKTGNYNVYIVDVNDNIYTMSIYLKHNDDANEIKISNIKKYSTKKVEKVSHDNDKYEATIVYKDNSKEIINSIYVSIIK